MRQKIAKRPCVQQRHLPYCTQGFFALCFIFEIYFCVTQGLSIKVRKEHRISEGKEPIAFPYRFGIGIQDMFPSCQC